MKKIFTLIAGLAFVALCVTSCKKDEKSDTLKDQLIKRTMMPAIVGQRIEFAYGMGSINSKLASMQVTASIPGAGGTIIDINTYKSNAAGADVATVVGANAATNGGTSSVTIIDTNATTLRYYYVVPEAARGQQVSFNFTVTNKAGEQVSTGTPAYSISKMSMVRNITMVGTAAGARFFSIADMKAYTQAEVDAGSLSGKIDFVYAYAATVSPSGTAYNYGHALVSPGADAAYFPAGFTMPAAWTKNKTAMEKKIGTAVYDGQLKGDATVGIYIDDADLEKQSFAGSANFAIGLTADASVFMKTADGKYTAFVYLNSVNNGTSTAVVSLKRIQNF